MKTHQSNTHFIRSSVLSLLLLTFTLSLSGQNTGAWYQQDFSGVNPEKRHESAFVEIDGLFYLIGGRSQRPIQVYNPVNKTWANTNTSTNNIHHFQAIAYQGKIYLIGALTGGFPNEDPLANILIYDPSQDQLTNGATIPVNRRRGSSGVVEYNGSFYIIGGNRNGHSAFLDGTNTPANVAWVDKYNPATDTWTVLPDAPHARDHFFAEVIGDMIYVAGGRRSKNGTSAGTWSDTEAAVDVFDLITEQWVSGNAVPDDLPTVRAGAATAVIGSELLVMGGEINNNPPDNLALPNTQALNPATGTWRNLADMNTGRHGTQAVVYNNDVYLAAGSRTRGGTEIGGSVDGFLEVFSFDGAPGSGTDYSDWTIINDANEARSEGQLISYGGEYFLLNGFDRKIEIVNSIEKYNPATNTWTLLKSMPANTAVTHEGVALVGDQIWLVGGRVGNNPGPVTDAVWIYDISQDSWSPGPKLPLRRGGGGLGRLGRKLHYVGGFDENASCDVDAHLVYDLDNPGAGWQDYSTTSPFPMPRNHFGTTVLGGKLYVVGGQFGHDGCGGGKDNDLFHVYDPAEDQWTRLADLPGDQSHAEPSTFSYNKKIYLVGGQTVRGDEVWEYSPNTDTWRIANEVALPERILAPGARVYDGNLFLLCGGTPSVREPQTTTQVKQFVPSSGFELVFNPGEIDLSLDVDDNAITKTVILANLNGEATAPFNITTNSFPGWLSVDKTSGSVRESFVEIDITVDPTGLANGDYNYTLQAKSSGYQSANLTVNLSVSGDSNPDPDPDPDPGPGGDDDFSIWLEGECAEVGSSWSEQSDNSASGQSFVAPPAGKNSYSSPPPVIAANLVSFNFAVPATDDYRLFTRLKAPSSSDDSFWVRVNGGSWIRWWQGLQTGNNFDWREVLGSPFMIPTGAVTIDFAYREDGTLLDKIYLTNTSTSPSGIGGTAENCGGPPPANQAPQAVAEASPTSGPAPLNVQLSAANSSDADGTIVSYAWNWPGGSTNGQQASIQLSSPGTYAVSLTVTDNDGATDQDVVQISVQSPPPPPTGGGSTVRLNAGGPQVNYDGNTFSADAMFNGGKTFTSSSASVPQLYKTERSSNKPFQFTYNIPVENGDYTVRLHFAEIYWGANGGGPGGSGRRVFDVSLEGQLVLNNYDINADVGPQTATVKEFPVSINDGSVDLFFDASTAAGGVDQPKLSGLEILPAAAPPPPPPPPPPPTSIAELWAEAECASGGDQWIVQNSSTASGGSYVTFPGNQLRPAPTSNITSEQLTFSVDLTEAGTYKLFFRLNTPPPNRTSANSFWVSLDGGNWIKYWKNKNNGDLLTNGFEWREVADNGAPISFNLGAGSHSIRVAPRETASQLDKIYLGQTTTPPNGMGESATNCPGGQLVAGRRLDGNHSRLVTPDESIELALFPNPTEATLNLHLTGPKQDRMEIQVIDVNGQILLRQTFTKGSGLHREVLDVTRLSPGTYYLRAIGTGELRLPSKAFVKM